MLTEDRAALSSAMLWGLALEGHGGMTGRVAVTSRLEREPSAPELAPTLTRDVIRAFAASAIGVNIALAAIDVWRLAYLPMMPGAIRAAITAAAIAIPLHIRHVIYGLRGERPPFGAWTLAMLAIVNAVAVQVVGPLWIYQFASLAVSILIVVPGVTGVVLAAAVVLSPLVLHGTDWFAPPLSFAGVYLTFAITWRAATQFVPLRLMAAIRALDLAGRELESRAVVQARVRIDAELREGVATALENIVARGEVARRAAEVDPTRATAELRDLVSDSRRALTNARRVVAGYRGSSVRAELDAAAALLEASGARVRIDVADGLALDSSDPHARREIRAAIARALRDEPNATYHVHVARDRSGTIEVVVSSTDGARDTDAGRDT
jgi:two-component system sensor histidine kinase DesK